MEPTATVPEGDDGPNFEEAYRRWWNWAADVGVKMQFVCSDCGDDCASDEDGCCQSCGRCVTVAPATLATPGPLPVARLEQAEALLREYVPDSHYAHFDREGNAGRTCPACIARSEWRERVRLFLAGQAVPVEVDPVEAILAIDCPRCAAASGTPCDQWEPDLSEYAFCASRIRASRTTTKEPSHAK